LKTRRLLRRVFLPPLYFVAAVVLVIEDFLWEPLGRLAAWVLARLRLGRLERWIAARRPYPAMALFLVPSVMLFPLKILALWLIGSGLKSAGIGLLVGAKIGGTAVVARLFALTKPTLLSIAWFARAYAFVTDVRAKVRASIIGRTAQALRARLSALRARLMPPGEGSRLGRFWRAMRARHYRPR